MDDQSGSKEQLLAELATLRERVGLLEASEHERLRIESALREARQRLEYLLAVSPAIIYTTQASGDYACTWVSGNLYPIMGYAPQEMTTDPKCWPALLHPDDAARVFAEMAPLIERGGGTIEYRFRHRDGHYVWFQDTFKVVCDATGRAQELVGAWADITERKRAEQAALAANAELHDTKRYLTRLIESSPDAIIATDAAGRVALCSEGAETRLGWRTDEIIGQPVARLYGGAAGLHEVAREMRKRGGTVSGLDGMLWAKDGSGIPVLISASVLFDDDGREVGMVGFHTDLRERKASEEALQKAHDELERRVEERTAELKDARGRLQYLLTVTPGIIYTNRVSDYRCTFVSQNVEPIMGFSTWEMLEDEEFWSKRLHPDDAARVFAEMAPLIGRGGGTVEYRFRHCDGHYAWIQDTFKVLADEAGQPREIVGSWADISDRKQVERALGERMALMNDLEKLVAASPAVIYATEAAGDYACTYVSENLMSTMGYAPWEMREDPRFWAKRLHPEDAARVFEQMAPLIERGGGTVEYRFRHRRGHHIWIQDTFTVRRDKDGRALELVGSWADISDRKRVEIELHEMAAQVELRNRFIRDTFGRYLTDEVVTALLESPAGLQMGGDKRKVTMLMADLRGFTALSERLAPQRVVGILNRYFEAMVGVIRSHGGTIDEFIGDAIFVLFGAPTWAEDDAARAVACAVEMQLAMGAVNAAIRADDLPEIEMGIGIHTGAVVVGNIGSPERMKYGVVGRHVNLASRIQSCTTGGQILVSEATRKEVGSILRTGRRIEVAVKGVEHPVTLSEALGIGGRYKLALATLAEALVPLAHEVALECAVVDGAAASEPFAGALVGLSPRGAEVRLERAVPTLDSVRLRFAAGTGLPGESMLAKVVGPVPEREGVFALRFTSLPPEAELALRQLRRSPRAAEPNREAA